MAVAKSKDEGKERYDETMALLQVDPWRGQEGQGDGSVARPFSTVEEASQFYKKLLREGRVVASWSPIVVVKCFDRNLLEEMALAWAMLTHKRLGNASLGSILLPELLESIFKLAERTVQPWLLREKQVNEFRPSYWGEQEYCSDYQFSCHFVTRCECDCEILQCSVEGCNTKVCKRHGDRGIGFWDPQQETLIFRTENSTVACDAHIKKFVW